MSIGIGNNQTYQVQIFDGGRVYNLTASQNGCVEIVDFTTLTPGCTDFLIDTDGSYRQLFQYYKRFLFN